MKQFLILISILFVLMSVLVSGCNSNYQQRIAKLEQQVAALAKQVQELSNENRLQPKVLEKDIEAPSDYQLPLQLKVGDRVEGEFSFSDGVLECKVKDPYGNTLFQTRHLEPYIFSPRGLATDMVWTHVDSPWRFAFIAATDGEYKLEFTCSWGRDLKPVHLKIVHYTGN